jgi:hypothetical protein
MTNSSKSEASTTERTFGTLREARAFARENGGRVFRNSGCYTQPGVGVTSYEYFTVKYPAPPQEVA